MPRGKRRPGANARAVSCHVDRWFETGYYGAPYGSTQVSAAEIDPIGVQHLRAQGLYYKVAIAFQRYGGAPASQ